ncbi:MAG: aminotransferase class V-fold PLP-dependent enzyme [Chloroflexi bacterium]|nr:aminotransferase class V-fold PLP-dependent enzyme [Chloroflexota bacterium]
MDIAAVRRQIPALARTLYFNTGWSGPSPTPVLEAIKAQLDYENNYGPTARPVLDARRQLTERTRQAVAGLIGATPQEITLTQNTTEGLNLVLGGLTWRPGDEVVTTNLEHSSGIVPLYYLRRRKRVRVRIADLRGAETPAAVLERLEAALTPRTRLLCLSHVMYTTGLLLPAREIQELARSRGVPVLWDAAQSVGHLPVNMKELGCDYYALPGHKWLLGPDGTGALFVRRDLIPQLQPPKVGGRAAAAYDFLGHMTPNTQEITKFELTTTSGPLWAGMVAAIEFLQNLGTENTWKRVRALSELAVAKLAEAPGVSIVSPRHPKLATGLVTFALEGAGPQPRKPGVSPWEQPHPLVSHLWERGQIVARWVGETPGVRLSVEFFNTEAELDRVVECVMSFPR